MLGDLDLKRIRDGLSGLEVPLTLIFHPGQESSEFSDQLSQAAREVEEAGQGVVTLKEGKGEGLPARPALTLSYRGHGNIHYLALPEGPETPLFLDALLGMPKGAAGIKEEWARKLAGLRKKAELYVFMATTCPHCAQAVRAATQVSLVSPPVSSYIIDAQRFPELAGKFSVKSVPMTILDGGLSQVGVIPPAELVDRIVNRGDPQHGARVFESLVETGRFQDAAAHVLEGPGAQHFLSAWRQSSTSTRVGLLLVTEELLEKNPRSLDGIVPGLLQLLAAEDAALRGDTADLLGQIGHPEAVEALTALTKDPNPDVAEIAADALEAIQERQQEE